MRKGENAANIFSPFPQSAFHASTDIHVLTFPQRQILDSSKLKECADDNFKFDENGRMFSNRVENTMGKGEIAR